MVRQRRWKPCRRKRKVILRLIIPSSTGLVESCANQGGLSPKAKYSLETDSEQVPWGKGEKQPGEGGEKYLKPCANKESESHFHGMTAFLLKNEPASL